MLDHAVREMKGEAAADEAEIQLNLGLNIRIPVNYIPEENQRFRMYKRVAGVETESHLRTLAPNWKTVTASLPRRCGIFWNMRR